MENGIWITDNVKPIPNIIRYPFSIKFMSAPLILTLKLDDASLDFFDALRRAHFPPERNFLSAHLTMFHHLPGEEIGKIKNDLAEICGASEKFPLAFSGWRFLGRGVAANVDAAQLLNLRARLASLWRESLTAQDRQKFQPHITVQNKVALEDARRLYEKLSAERKPSGGVAEGLTLWHYLGAAWRREEDFPFTADERAGKF